MNIQYIIKSQTTLTNGLNTTCSMHKLYEQWQLSQYSN